jgi:hypothetical protein
MPGTPRRWSKRVTQTSNALDLEENVFLKDDPAVIAQSLKRSADESRRRKTDSYRSAMSMLTFYINRAGSNLEPSRRRVLEQAKNELRELYGRSAGRPPRAPRHGRASSARARAAQ